MTTHVPWTTPDQIKDQVERYWQRGAIVRARLLDEPLFPLEIRLKRPGAKDIAERFGDVMAWIDVLRDGSQERVGYGYTLLWQRVTNRVQGTNELPVAAVVHTEEDALRLIRRVTEADRLWRLAQLIIDRYPSLRPWVARRFRSVLDHGDRWEQLLAVVDWFVAHPHSGLYLRQLDIPGVDTKFIENHRGILTEMLDLVLPPTAIDARYSGAAQFAPRYGLRQEPTTLRFRILDPALYIQGLSDLTVLSDEFARLNLRPSRVFITENQTNGLAFPGCTGSIVIFGLGYGIDRLAEIPWLHTSDVLYWGDIDTHGFGILHRLRGVLPHVRSFLMDRDTLLAHRTMWVQEHADKRYTGEPSRLTDEEYALFDDLRYDRIGSCVRLEQERIRWSWLEDYLNEHQKQ